MLISSGLTPMHMCLGNLSYCCRFWSLSNFLGMLKIGISGEINCQIHSNLSEKKLWKILIIRLFAIQGRLLYMQMHTTVKIKLVQELMCRKQILAKYERNPHCTLPQWGLPCTKAKFSVAGVINWKSPTSAGIHWVRLGLLPCWRLDGGSRRLWLSLRKVEA